MVGIDVGQLGLELGSGAVVGGIVGFAAKKLAKVVAVIVGLELALFKFLESQGILRVDWRRLTGGIVTGVSGAPPDAPPNWVMSILSTLPVSTGFVGGFLLGFRRG